MSFEIWTGILKGLLNVPLVPDCNSKAVDNVWCKCVALE